MPAPLLLALLGCAPGAVVDTASVVDLRQDFPDPPEGGLQIRSPDLEIPPYTEQEFCFFGTYRGEDVGLHASEDFQSEGGHHVVLLVTNYTEGEFPDGELYDCTDPDSLDMLRLEPLFIQDVDDDSVASLPEGMAMSFPGGTRYILQSHYINTSADTILVQDAINLELVPEDTVETWASTIAQSTLGFSVPSGESLTAELSCTFEEDLMLLNMSGHMHETGSAFSVDHVRGDETARIYDIPQWLPEYRDFPIVEDFGGQPFEIKAGDTFVTACSWLNNTDHALGFPEEMCATVGVVYPRKEALTCVDF